MTLCQTVTLMERMRCKAGSLREGDYIPYARRTVVKVESRDAFRVRVVARNGGGEHFVYEWSSATPVIIAARPLHTEGDPAAEREWIEGA